MTAVLAPHIDTAALYPPTVAPPAEPLSLARFLAAFVRNPLLVLPAAVYREPILQYRGGMVTWVTDPGLVKTVLLDARDAFAKTPLERRVLGPLLGKGILISDGADWRWQRHTAAPLFRHADLLRYVPAMVAGTEPAISEWRSGAPGAMHRIDEQMSAATFRVISDTMLHGGETYVGPALERANTDYLLPISWPIAYGVLGLPAWMPYPGRAGMRRAEQRMRSAVAEMVKARRHAPGPDDLFARLLRATDPETGRPMTDAQLVDNLLTFLLAGHETTAKALTWSLYLVARSPAWERRMLEEIDAVAGDGPIMPSHVDKLVEVAKVLKEAMRLYPPAPVLTRIATAATELGGIRLPAGSLVVMPIFAIHRHQRLWEDPDRFDPDRFAPECEAKHSRYQFMPFGAGPRICIGASFAMIEATAMLASFVRAARFGVPPGHVPTPISRVTLRPTGGMPLHVWPREGMEPLAHAA